MCFGTGDGWPCVGRGHASFLYGLGGTSLLVDCGEPIDSRFKATGLSYDTFDAILLSHLHADHVGGLFMLLQGCWLEGRRKPLPIYLPSRAIPALRRMLRTVFIFDELLPFDLQLRPWPAAGAVRVRGARVSVFPTSHLNGFRAHFATKYRVDFRAYCLLLEGGGLRVGHSADLGQPADLEPLLQKPLDLLVCELAHFAPEALFSFLGGRKVKRVVFVHLSRTNWENLDRVRRLAKRLLPDIPHTFARDGEHIRI
jgi:phosphoribosyl 1,2-cyclic phosphodiesterase